MRSIFCLSALLFIFSCKSTKDTTESGDTGELQISLKKGGCFGKCPIYTFNIYKGGSCEFIGKKNTSKIGKYSLQLSKDRYKKIKEAFEESDYDKFDDTYESNIADLPTIIISYLTKGKMKTITGKRERPERVHKLQFLLEQISENDKGWTFIGELDEAQEEKQKEYIKSEIVLQIKEAGQLSRWFDNMRKTHSLRIIKPLSTDTNTWLVSYDKNKYLPNEILLILRNDENVASAEFNVKTNNR